MNRFVRIKWLLLPSILGGSVVLLVSCSMLVAAGWTYVTDNQLFYDYLFSAYGSLTALQASPDSFSALRAGLLNGAATYNILVAVVAVGASVITFIVFEGVRHFASGLSVAVGEIRHGISPTSSTKEMIARFFARLASLVGWMVYTFLFLSVLVPTSGLLTQLALDGAAASALQDLLYFVPALGLLAVGLHLHVVFARLTLLRLRLFGGLDVEMEAIEEDLGHIR